MSKKSLSPILEKFLNNNIEHYYKIVDREDKKHKGMGLFAQLFRSKAPICYVLDGLFDDGNGRNYVRNGGWNEEGVVDFGSKASFLVSNLVNVVSIAHVLKVGFNIIFVANLLYSRHACNQLAYSLYPDLIAVLVPLSVYKVLKTVILENLVLLLVS